MRNVQKRLITSSAATVGALLDTAAGERDRLWPTPRWPALRLRDGLVPGSSGGHGPIRYRLTEYEVGRRLRFEFDRRTGIVGYHELRVEPAGPASCQLIHEIRGRTTGQMTLLWPLAVRWLHEALMADLFDNAERASTGALAEPARHTRWVRLLRRALQPRPYRTNVSARARSLLQPTDLADAWTIRLSPGMPSDPTIWTDAVFHTVPRWVSGLLRLRNRLAPLIGIPPGTPAAFAIRAVFDDEVILGTDDAHLDFRASVRVHGDEVSVSTVARATNRRGHVYLLAIRAFHPPIVRAMLARAARAMTA